MNSYVGVKKFLAKYPFTIAWRVRQHASIIDKHLNPGEEILYIFAGQKNDRAVDIMNTYVVAFTNKRILLATKRLVFGYFFITVTPDMYNDLTIRRGLLFGSVTLDTIKEVITITNIDPRALPEIETNISEIMMEQKKKYVKEKEENKKESE